MDAKADLHLCCSHVISFVMMWPAVSLHNIMHVVYEPHCEQPIFRGANPG